MIELIVMVQRQRRRIVQRRGFQEFLHGLVIARDEIDHVEKAEKAKGTWHLLRHQHDHEEELEVLRFASANFAEAFSTIYTRSTLLKMHTISTFSKRFETSRDETMSKVLLMFAAEIARQPGLAPLPTRDDMRQYLNSLDAVMTSQVPNPRQVGYQQCSFQQFGRMQRRHPSPDNVKAEILHALANKISKATQRYMRFPLLHWFSEALLFSTDQAGHVGATIPNWQKEGENIGNGPNRLGAGQVFAAFELSDILERLCQTTDMEESDVESGGQRQVPHRRARQTVSTALTRCCLSNLPAFRLHLAKLEGIKIGQIAWAKKIQTGAATVVIAAGSPLIKMVLGSFFPAETTTASPGLVWHV